MTNLDIVLPDTLNIRLVPTVVEEVCASANLHETMKSTLKKFPGCVHWHFKKEGEKGILEVTWWPREDAAQLSRLWLSVHGNRTADWIQQIKPQIKTMIEVSLAKKEIAK
ncbi:MAG: hypothetical protein AAF871_09555 [Pseudomonadota bacterium]